MEKLFQNISNTVSNKLIAKLLLAQVVLLIIWQLLMLNNLFISYLTITNIVFALFIWFTAEEFENHLSLFGLFFIYKLISIGFILLLTFDQKNLLFTSVNFIFDFIILSSLGYKLNFYNRLNDDADFNLHLINQSFNYIRTNKGDTLAELAQKHRILLIFVRHFGCTFCRANVDELSKVKTEIDELKILPVFVHMSDRSFAEEFFEQYYKSDVTFVSDPNLKLYKAFGLKRGSLLQLFGLSTWIHGIYGSLFKGYGLGEAEGDVMQLGGYFIYYKGQVEFQYPLKNASEKFNLGQIKKFLK